MQLLLYFEKLTAVICGTFVSARNSCKGMRLDSIYFKCDSLEHLSAGDSSILSLPVSSVKLIADAD
jgi:hypothetical protein